MKTNLFTVFAFTFVALISCETGMAQNAPPYWSLAGNSNATNGSKLGTTNSASLRFYTNNKQRMIIDAAGFVGIGTSSPVNILTVKSSGGTPASRWLNGVNSPIFMGFSEEVSSEMVLAAASNTSKNRAVFQGRRSRGTLNFPTILLNNDYITSFVASGFDGATFQNPASIDFYVDGTVIPGTLPARISFVTGSNAGNRKERLKIGSTGNVNFNGGQVYLQQSSGNVGIGTTTPVSKLEVLNGLLTITNTITSASLVLNRANSVAGSSNQIIFQDNGVTKWASGGTNIGSAGTDNFSLYNYNLAANALTISNSNNNVGIGTTSPGTRLQVAAGYDGDGISVIGSSSGPKDAGFILADNLGNYGSLGLASADNAFMSGARSGDIILSNTGGKIHLGTGSASSFPTMTVSGGNVAIGTLSSGGYKLKISHGNSGGLDIENAATLDNWEFLTLGNAVGGEQYRGSLFLFCNTVFKGSFDATNGSYSTISDERLKTNISPMSSMLEKINQLKPSSYQFKNTADKQQYNGFIAQDVMKIFPGLVKHSILAERNLDIYTMDYSGFGVLAIKGIQELQPLIEEQNIINEEQKEEIASLKERIYKLETALATLNLNNGNNTNLVTDAFLEQNKPNPVTGNTIIRYQVPLTAISAKLTITNIKGQLIKTITISKMGAGQISLNGRALASGTYNYSLWVDGKQVETRRLINSK